MKKNGVKILIFLVNCLVLVFLPMIDYGQQPYPKSVTVPFVLDHNRMLIDAEMQRKDSTWRKVRIWVDCGSTDFMISESLAFDLGIDLSFTKDSGFRSSRFGVSPSPLIRIGGMQLNLDSVSTNVVFRPYWLFTTMHCDANLPASILRKYHIVLDYPKNRFTIALQGELKPRGIVCDAIIHPETGIIQLDAVMDSDSLSFALDNGASYSFISEESLLKFTNKHPDRPKITGTLGYANMWGWWPANEQEFPVVTIPEMKWGNVVIRNLGIAGVVKSDPGSLSIGEWYSQKTSQPVAGFLGANALKMYRVEIDYSTGKIYFQKGKNIVKPDMDIVGISVRQLPDSSYQILNVAHGAGKALVDSVRTGDILIGIDDLKTRGATMGTVVDALRGKPGEIRSLFLERNGRKFIVKAKVEHFL